MVLGEGETCTGDPARRAGNEFLFQMQAMQNVEILNEIKAKKIVVTCPHCLNTLGREYPQLGGNYEVVHHSQLLATLVKDGRLTPVTPVDGTVTYHDPCYLGRHNKVYTPPRELIGSLPGLTLHEMERSADRSFCCGAGGARMWMEEKLGTRINLNRTDEALGHRRVDDRGGVPVLLGDDQRRRHQPLAGQGRAGRRGRGRRDPAARLASAPDPAAPRGASGQERPRAASSRYGASARAKVAVRWSVSR